MWSVIKERIKMHIDVKEFQKLKNDIDVINNRINLANIRKDNAKNKVAEILQTYQVATVEEFENLVLEKEAELEKLLLSAQSFVVKTRPVLDEVESKLNGFN